MADTVYRLRVTYGKTGRGRWLSHLEVARACERSIRRAGLPYQVTQGFTPRMKVAFGPALPVGTSGEAERYDVWLTSFLPPAEALDGLRRATPVVLAPSQVAYAREGEPSLAAALTLAHYEVEVEGEQARTDEVRKALASVLADATLTLERKGGTKVFDLDECLPKEPIVEASEGGVTVRLTIRMGGSGSLRPEALIASALECSRVDAAVSAVVRTDLSSEVRTE